MSKKYILISVLSKEKLTKDLGQSILSLFYEKYSLLAPQYANYIEPVNKPVSTIEEGLEYWEIDPIYYRRKVSVKGWWNIGTDWQSISRLKFEYNWNKKIDWFSLFQHIIQLSNAYFGYIHIITEEENKPCYAQSAASFFLVGASSNHLKKGIPQLGWGNYFGEEYVKEIDVDRLKKNGFEIKPLGEGYVFNVTPQLSDVITNYEEFDARRTLLKSLFRPGLFQKYSPIDEDAEEHPLMKHVRKLEAERNKIS